MKINIVRHESACYNQIHIKYRSKITTDIESIVKLIKEANPEVPCVVGFGISGAEQVKAMSAISDGAIVGSAIVKIIAVHGKEAVFYVTEFVKEMKAAQK